MNCESIIKFIKYYYWCALEMYQDYVNPPCPECGVKKVS